jgi:glycosyltransferase involved in cell wall biosynthesis
VKLLIISNMAHWRAGDTIVGHGATARELDVLATLFDEVRHVACLHDETAPASALPYRAPNLTLVPLVPAGGNHLAAKLDIVRRLPEYTRVIARELPHADAVHVRCPANVTLCALAVLALRRAPTRRWIKYAGAWEPNGPEPASYGLQRRWLARPHLHAQVTITGARGAVPPHVHAIANPCLSADELARGLALAREKRFTTPLRLVFVGHLGAAKNPRAAIDCVRALRDRGHAAELDVAGDGEELASLRSHAAGLPVRVHGALPRTALDALYAAAHFVVLPSLTEGWPKVLAEGMAAGAVPISTDVGSIRATLESIGVGHALPLPVDGALLANAIAAYTEERWSRESARAVAAADAFGYDRYLDNVRELLAL